MAEKEQTEATDQDSPDGDVSLQVFVSSCWDSASSIAATVRLVAANACPAGLFVIVSPVYGLASGT
jgi:hypothetical protein